MALNNEEEFKIEQNHKLYSIIINIQEEQLALVLINLSSQQKKYSGFFSLNELRISSKIFEHTKTIFEAKEIIKRTVIKKQLLIDEDEFRTKITFDSGLGHDSVPFPIILFRDSNDKQPNITNYIKNNNEINNDLKDPEDNLKKLFINKLGKKNNNIKSNANENPFLRASIGNNVNNKMINNVGNNGQVQFNNSMKLSSSKIFLNNNIKKMETNYKEIDLRNNNININKNMDNGLNNLNQVKNKDFVEMNNNILYNIYHNMNDNNNINSSFYKDLSKSFALSNNNINENNVNNIPLMKKDFKNIDNNLSNSNIVPVQNLINLNNNNNNNLHPLNNNIKLMNNPNYNLKINNPNIPMQINPNINQNINVNKKIPIQPIYPLNTNQIKNINPALNQKNLILPQNTYQQNIPKIQNQALNPAIIINNQSFHTAPIQRNQVQIPNIDSRIDKNIIFKNNKRKTYNIKNKNEDMRLSISEESDEDNNLDDDIEEYDKNGEQPYRFKNLLIQGSKKVKGNLEKFKKNQNIGDYKPSGEKFVSYLKFPDTKKHISNKSLTLSTISSSITSGSNRLTGIEKNIIKHPGELEEISSRIKRILNKKNIKCKIIFRANIDGDLASTFHSKCDGIKNTLILIKASGNKRFGGFTTETWDGDDINKKDNQSFIFSIDKMKIYDVIEGENAINCNQDLGPVFVNQIKLFDQFFTQGGTTCKKGINFKTNIDFELTEGAEKFGVQDVEVYQIK